MPNKSNRPWKSGKKKMSTLNATAASKVSFNERRDRQKKLQQVKQVAQEIRSEEVRKREQERKRQEAMKKAREENLIKSAKVQNVTDIRKIKRLSKKQLMKSRIYLTSHFNATGGAMDR